MGVPQILVLFFIIRSLIQFVKKIRIKKTLEWENIVAFVLGGLATLVWDTGLLQLGSIPVPDSVVVASIVEFLLFGVATAEGAGWLHEFINTARTNQDG